MVNIQQANFIARHLVRLHPLNHFWINTVAGIAYRHPHPVTALRHAYRHHAFAFARLDAVDNGIFHQRLDQQARDHAVYLFINVVDDGELVAKPRLLDGDVILNLVELFFDVDLLIILQLNVVAQVARQIKDQLTGGVRIQADRRGDGVQGVEQEMGINFTLQGA